MAYFKESSLCDLLHNNVSECFNSFSLDVLGKSIIICPEMLRRQFMIRFEEKQKITEKCNSITCPQIMRKIRMRCKEASKMQVFYVEIVTMR